MEPRLWWGLLGWWGHREAVSEGVEGEGGRGRNPSLEGVSPSMMMQSILLGFDKW